MQAAMQHATLPASPRDRLLNCATELFALQGYHAISLRDLANHVGVQAGSLYHHIDSKQSLLFELIEDTLNDLLFCTRKQLKRARNPRERLRQFVRAFVLFKHASHHRITLVRREQVNLTAEQAAQIEGAKYDYLMILGGIIADLNQHTGTPSPLMKFAADAAIGMLFSQAQWCTLEISPQNLVETLTQFTHGIIQSSLSTPAISVGSTTNRTNNRSKT